MKKYIIKDRRKIVDAKSSERWIMKKVHKGESETLWNLWNLTQMNTHGERILMKKRENWTLHYERRGGEWRF